MKHVNKNILDLIKDENLKDGDSIYFSYVKTLSPKIYFDNENLIQSNTNVSHLKIISISPDFNSFTYKMITGGSVNLKIENSEIKASVKEKNYSDDDAKILEFSRIEDGGGNFVYSNSPFELLKYFTIEFQKELLEQAGKLTDIISEL